MTKEQILDLRNYPKEHQRAIAVALNVASLLGCSPTDMEIIKMLVEKFRPAK